MTSKFYLQIIRLFSIRKILKIFLKLEQIQYKFLSNQLKSTMTKDKEQTECHFNMRKHEKHATNIRGIGPLI